MDNSLVKIGEAPTVCQARVSHRDPRGDLDQCRTGTYTAAQGWRCAVIRDLDAGMNHHKTGDPGLARVQMVRRQIRCLVLIHQDSTFR